MALAGMSSAKEPSSMRPDSSDFEILSDGSCFEKAVSKRKKQSKEEKRERRRKRKEKRKNADGDDIPHQTQSQHVEPANWAWKTEKHEDNPEDDHEDGHDAQVWTLPGIRQKSEDVSDSDGSDQKGLFTPGSRSATPRRVAATQTLSRKREASRKAMLTSMEALKSQTPKSPRGLHCIKHMIKWWLDAAQPSSFMDFFGEMRQVLRKIDVSISRINGIREPFRRGAAQKVAHRLRNWIQDDAMLGMVATELLRGEMPIKNAKSPRATKKKAVESDDPDAGAIGTMQDIAPPSKRKAVEQDDSGVESASEQEAGPRKRSKKSKAEMMEVTTVAVADDAALSMAGSESMPNKRFRSSKVTAAERSAETTQIVLSASSNDIFGSTAEFSNVKGSSLAPAKKHALSRPNSTNPEAEAGKSSKGMAPAASRSSKAKKPYQGTSDGESISDEQSFYPTPPITNSEAGPSQSSKANVIETRRSAKRAVAIRPSIEKKFSSGKLPKVKKAIADALAEPVISALDEDIPAPASDRSPKRRAANAKSTIDTVKGTRSCSTKPIVHPATEIKIKQEPDPPALTAKQVRAQALQRAAAAATMPTPPNSSPQVKREIAAPSAAKKSTQALQPTSSSSPSFRARRLFRVDQKARSRRGVTCPPPWMSSHGESRAGTKGVRRPCLEGL